MSLDALHCSNSARDIEIFSFAIARPGSQVPDDMKTLVSLLAVFATAALADDWPMHGKDARRSHVSSDSLEFPLERAWARSVDQTPQPAWPEPVKNLNRLDFDYAPQLAVAGGLVVYGSSADDTVRALDAETGDLKWSFTTGGPVRFGPQIEGNGVFFGSDDGKVYRLNSATGEPVWIFDAAPSPELVLGNGRMISRWPVRTGVLVENGVVFATAGLWSAEGVFIYALDAETGAEIWCNDTCGTLPLMGAHQTFSLTGVNPQGNLLASDDVLLVPTGRTSPAGFDKRSGKFLFFDPGHHNNGFGGSRLTIENDRVYAYSKNFYSPLGVRALDLATGAMVADVRHSVPQHSTFIREKSYSVYDGKTCFVMSGGTMHAEAAYGLALAGETRIIGDAGRVRAGDWEAEVSGQAREFAIAEGRLFVSTSTGEISCFATATGRKPITIEPRPATTPNSRGYALVFGDVDRAKAIAQEGQLQVVLVSEAAESIRAELIANSDWYGSRVHVLAIAAGQQLPFPSYFANLIVGGEEFAEETFRVLRPCGGRWIKSSGEVVVRQQLPGALDWNSESKGDELVRWPLRPIWFGGPGPAKMLSRKHRSPTLAFANGRYFVKGEHDLLAVDAYNGTELWTREISGIAALNADADHVYATLEDGGIVLDAASGAEIKGEKIPDEYTKWPRPRIDPAVTTAPRIHPLTGAKMPKVWIKTFGCSGVSTSATSLFTRSGTVSIYDFEDDSGMRNFGGLRPSCGQSTIAALGLWIVNEGSSACECSYSYQTSLAFAPASRRLNEDWAVFYDWRVDSIVRQAHLNLGAPGDRRDENSQLWIGAPRPGIEETIMPKIPGSNSWLNIPGIPQQKMPVAIQVPLTIETDEAPESGPYRVNADRIPIANTDRPWIYASVIRGIRKATLKLDFQTQLISQPAPAPPKIDGVLDFAEPLFILPDSQTKVFIHHDDTNLYIASSRPATIDRKGARSPWVQREGPHDRPVWNDDSWEIFLSNAGSETVLHFGLSASGGAYDAAENSRWNPEWRHAVVADENAFVTESAIPWAVLAAAGVNRETLGVNFQINRRHNIGEALQYLGFQGRVRCEHFAPLGLGKPPETPPRNYTVRLHFAEFDDLAPGDRVFDVRVQGKTALANFDVVSAAAGRRTAVVREIQGVSAIDELTIELEPKSGSPILSGIEIFVAELEPKG
ncbi:MAG: outer membrane protein assembly factor BamB [Verrucomicrobiales bacterium]|jgi:outer membrane protein assembly factor BamB